jgi:multidrug transporter EmrE-like cation transporter
MRPATSVYLIRTVAFEAFGTACIRASEQFTRVWPSLGMILGYGGAFGFLAQVLRDLPLGVVYAVWSGLGIGLAAVIGRTVFGQRISPQGMVGIGLMAAGIMVRHLSVRS